MAYEDLPDEQRHLPGERSWSKDKGDTSFDDDEDLDDEDLDDEDEEDEDDGDEDGKEIYEEGEL